jgi:hypothetical protein
MAMSQAKPVMMLARWNSQAQEPSACRADQGRAGP